jgi:hypothetical protein
MFKALKYLFLANLYKKAKKSFVMLFGSVATLILFTFIVNDILSISAGAMVVLVMSIKWIVIIFLLAFIVLNVLKILNVATKPFESKKENVEVVSESEDLKKHKILSKDKLFTQSDLIYQKYTKAKES